MIFSKSFRVGTVLCMSRMIMMVTERACKELNIVPHTWGTFSKMLRGRVENVIWYKGNRNMSAITFLCLCNPAKVVNRTYHSQFALQTNVSFIIEQLVYDCSCYPPTHTLDHGILSNWKSAAEKKIIKRRDWEKKDWTGEKGQVFNLASTVAVKIQSKKKVCLYEIKKEIRKEEGDGLCGQEGA